MKISAQLALLISSCFLIIGCANEKQVMITAFDELYSDVVEMNFDGIYDRLDGASQTFYDDVTAAENLNIDSMIVLGAKYKLPYMLTDFLAIQGDRIKEGGSSTDFYKYLGRQEISIFSYGDAFYVEPAKSRLGKDNFVAILKDQMEFTKRGWAKFSKTEDGQYKYDLLYTLKTREAAKLKTNTALRKKSPDKETLADYLSFYYWQNSGENTEKFEAQVEKLHQDMLAARKEKLEIIKSRKRVDY